MQTLNASAEYGLSGQYIARIIGRDSKYTFNREFIGRKGGKRNEGTSADVDENGLYEMCDVTKRGKDSRYCVIIDCPSLEVLPNAHPGTLRKIPVDKEDAMKVARAMDEGRNLTDIIAVSVGTNTRGNLDYVYELLSPKQAERHQSAATIASATDTCWNAIQALPLKDAKAVLKALKEKLMPTPSPAATQPEAQTAVEPATP